MVKSTFYYIFSCAVLLSVVHGFEINECSQGGLIPEEISIANCAPDANICSVKFNGIFNMTMKFRAPHYLESMKPNLTGKTIFATKTFSGTTTNEDVCTGILNTMCPVVEKEEIEYSYSVDFLVLPLMPVNMEFSILDLSLGETTVCFSFHVLPLL